MGKSQKRQRQVKGGERERWKKRNREKQKRTKRTENSGEGNECM